MGSREMEALEIAEAVFPGLLEVFNTWAHVEEHVDADGEKEFKIEAPFCMRDEGVFIGKIAKLLEPFLTLTSDEDRKAARWLERLATVRCEVDGISLEDAWWKTYEKEAG